MSMAPNVSTQRVFPLQEFQRSSRCPHRLPTEQASHFVRSPLAYTIKSEDISSHYWLLLSLWYFNGIRSLGIPSLFYFNVAYFLWKSPLMLQGLRQIWPRSRSLGSISFLMQNDANEPNLMQNSARFWNSPDDLLFYRQMAYYLANLAVRRMEFCPSFFFFLC